MKFSNYQKYVSQTFTAYFEEDLCLLSFSQFLHITDNFEMNSEVSQDLLNKKIILNLTKYNL